MKWYQYLILIAIMLVDLDWSVHFYDQTKIAKNWFNHMGDWVACVVLGMKGVLIGFFVLAQLFIL
jgi:hypothetical protein